MKDRMSTEHEPDTLVFSNEPLADHLTPQSIKTSRSNGQYSLLPIKSEESLNVLTIYHYQATSLFTLCSYPVPIIISFCSSYCSLQLELLGWLKISNLVTTESPQHILSISFFSFMIHFYSFVHRIKKILTMHSMQKLLLLDKNNI